MRDLTTHALQGTMEEEVREQMGREDGRKTVNGNFLLLLSSAPSLPSAAPNIPSYCPGRASRIPLPPPPCMRTAAVDERAFNATIAASRLPTNIISSVYIQCLGIPKYIITRVHCHALAKPWHDPMPSHQPPNPSSLHNKNKNKKSPLFQTLASTKHPAPSHRSGSATLTHAAATLVPRPATIRFGEQMRVATSPKSHQSPVAKPRPDACLPFLHTDSTLWGQPYCRCALIDMQGPVSQCRPTLHHNNYYATPSATCPIHPPPLLPPAQIP